MRSTILYFNSSVSCSLFFLFSSSYFLHLYWQRGSLEASATTFFISTATFACIRYLCHLCLHYQHYLTFANTTTTSCCVFISFYTHLSTNFYPHGHHSTVQINELLTFPSSFPPLATIAIADGGITMQQFCLPASGSFSYSVSQPFKVWQ